MHSAPRRVRRTSGKAEWRLDRSPSQWRSDPGSQRLSGNRKTRRECMGTRRRDAGRPGWFQNALAFGSGAIRGPPRSHGVVSISRRLRRPFDGGGWNGQPLPGSTPKNIPTARRLDGVVAIDAERIAGPSRATGECHSMLAETSGNLADSLWASRWPSQRPVARGRSGSGDPFVYRGRNVDRAAHRHSCSGDVPRRQKPRRISPQRDRSTSLRHAICIGSFAGDGNPCSSNGCSSLVIADSGCDGTDRPFDPYPQSCIAHHAKFANTEGAATFRLLKIMHRVKGPLGPGTPVHASQFLRRRTTVASSSPPRPTLILFPAHAKSEWQPCRGRCGAPCYRASRR